VTAHALTPTLRRFLLAIAEDRWTQESGNRLAAADRLKKLGLVAWIFTPYTLGAYGGTSHPALTPKGQDAIAEMRAAKKTRARLDAEIAEVLAEKPR
jgi:hypothetical protein